MGGLPAPGDSPMNHKIIYMSARRVKCHCGWSSVIPDDETPGTVRAQDCLLDQHDVHSAMAVNTNG